MGRFSRSWDLIKACFGVLRDDKELLLFPIISSIAAIFVMASFALPLFFTGLFQHGAGPLGVVVGFLFYLCLYTVIFFFNAALVGAALIRLKGGNPTVSDGLTIAKQNIGAIIGYAAIAATVGMLLKAKGKRSGFIADMIRSIAGMAWTLSTFLVVPVLVSQKIGPIDAIKVSANLLKKTWGENLIGSAGIWIGFGIVSFFYILLSIVLIFAVAQASTGLAIGLGILLAFGLALISIIKSAISAIYTAALYRYAADGEAPQGFESQQLALAFKP
ncbi:MAG: hypothetical protein KA902_06390 [Arenimonas sp.]|nr:hypothetical protein [Arenimonas sp.]